jgi:Zn-dependent metalloprotease
MRILKKLFFIFLLLFPIAAFYYFNPTITTFSSTLNAYELREVDLLFTKNNISSANLFPYKIIRDDEGTTQIRVYQVYEGLQVNEELHFNFETDTGKLYFLSGYPVPNLPISAKPERESNADLVEKSMNIIFSDNSDYIKNARPITITTKPKIPAYVASFLAHISQEYLTYPHPLEARLLIYNKNSSSDEPQEWTLAWEITPKNENYPIVLVDANTGSILYSFDGVYIEVIRERSPQEVRQYY